MKIIIDAVMLISTRYHSDPKWLVKSGTADTFMADPRFTTTPVVHPQL